VYERAAPASPLRVQRHNRRVPAPPLLWDLFCRVVDNHGDLGVCWRLARELAARAHEVRLWVDDAGALDWMAPGATEGAVPGVKVLPWNDARCNDVLAALAPADVWVEAFGCEIEASFVAARAGSTEAGSSAAATAPAAPPASGGSGVSRESPSTTTSPPVWINLEYLSAEGYVERMHRLPSPVLHGPAAGWTKWFFYPGFTPRTGGLLRERDLATRQATFERTAWLRAQGIGWHGERLVSLFCYEPPGLPALLDQLRDTDPATRLLVTAGRANAALRQAMADRHTAHESPDDADQPSKPSLTWLPTLPQTGYDELLWACDLNFVRGEDSLVRALWAGAPFVWQIYPQHGAAHHAKLQAFLDWLRAPPSLRRFHQIWNGIDGGALPLPDLPAWRACVEAARARLLAQDDLCTQLLRFIAEKR